MRGLVFPADAGDNGTVGEASHYYPASGRGASRMLAGAAGLTDAADGHMCSEAGDLSDVVPMVAHQQPVHRHLCHHPRSGQRASNRGIPRWHMVPPVSRGPTVRTTGEAPAESTHTLILSNYSNYM